MSLDWLKFSEWNQKVEKQDFLAIDTSHIFSQSKIIKRIKQEEYADNIDNKVTIPSDLQDYFPDDEITEKEISKFAKFKKELYQKLWLNEILEENTDLQKFEKWLIDWWFLDNVEMLWDLAEASVEEKIWIIKQLWNWDTIKAILIDLYNSIEDITKVFQNPYEWWKALWALWIWPVSKSLKSLRLANKFWKKENIELLEKYSESLWEKLKLEDIIWEWNNAIIVAHPSKNDKVLKIAKQWRNIDKLDLEFEKHTKFQEFLEIYNWNWVEWKVLNDFYIPWIKNFDWIDGVYEMDRIDWLSLKSLIHLEYNIDKLINIPNNIYNWLSQRQLLDFLKDNWLSSRDLELLLYRWVADSDIINFLKEKWLKVYPEWKNWYKEKNKPYVQEFIRSWFTNDIYKNKITPFNDILKKNWFYHNDIHWWNYMIREDWKIIMIDFWNSEIKNFTK